MTHKVGVGNTIKNFFGLGGSSRHEHPGARTVYYTIPPHMLKDLNLGTSQSTRIKTVKDLTETVRTHRLEEHVVERLWTLLRDLLKPNINRDDRHAVLRFVTALIQGQYEQLKLVRVTFFNLLRENKIPEDLHLRLDILHHLTKKGRDVAYFESDVGALLVRLMTDTMYTDRAGQFLDLLTQFIKFNSCYIDITQLTTIVINICHIATNTQREEDLDRCIQALDAVVCYSSLPGSALTQVILCLCQVVNIGKFCAKSWNLMKNILGTYRGQTVICMMCYMLDHSYSITSTQEERIMRGAVFYVSKALWGSDKVQQLKSTAVSVLPSFLKSVEFCKTNIVGYEVVLSLDRLIKKHGPDIHVATWDLVLNIVEELLNREQAYVETIAKKLHGVLNRIDELIQNKSFNGSHDQYFSIIELCARVRPESSLVLMIKYKISKTHSTEKAWLRNMQILMDTYFKHEKRTLLRKQVLHLLTDVLDSSTSFYEEEILDQLVIPHMGALDHETDGIIRHESVKLVLHCLRHNYDTRCVELVDVLARVLHSSFTRATQQKTVEQTDVTAAVHGLIEIFRRKIMSPQHHTSYLVYIYATLVNYIMMIYRQPIAMYTHMVEPRKQILSLLLDLRVDELSRIGLANNKQHHKLIHNPYLRATDSDKDWEPVALSSSTRASPSVLQNKKETIQLTHAVAAINDCLRQETSWSVLSEVFSKLPAMLHNRTFFITINPDITQDTTVHLCNMVRRTNITQALHNTPSGFTTSEFHAQLFPVITCLVPYHVLFHKDLQKDIIHCLDFALVSKVARVCMSALTVCAYEMQDAMTSYVPRLLQKMSQISADAAKAVPLMEFLSSLLQVSRLYMNFTEEQYRRIFAISLPYTNPFKYQYYTVVLAYYVITKWFIKCRLPYRRRLVSFIIQGLRANVIRPFDEKASRKAALQNMDSISRSRAQSMIERGNSATMAKQRARQMQHSDQPRASHSDQDDEWLSVLHKDLMETCTDMLSRYTFSSNTTMPERSALAEFLLKGGQVESWLLGSKVITIATSGGFKANNDSSLCDMCLEKLRAGRAANNLSNSANDGDSMDARSLVSTTDGAGGDELPSLADIGGARGGLTISGDGSTASGGGGGGRRRHKSAAVKSSSPSLLQQTKRLSVDDMDVKASESATSAGIPIQGGRHGMGGAGVGEGDNTTMGVSPMSQASSITQTSDSFKALDNFLMGFRGLRGKGMRRCNCWCTQWAEVKVRHATGTSAWMMRTEMKQDTNEAMLVDIANLLTAGTVDTQHSYDAWIKQQMEHMGGTTAAASEEQSYNKMHEEHFCAPDNMKAGDGGAHRLPGCREGELLYHCSRPSGGSPAASEHSGTLSEANSITDEINEWILGEDRTMDDSTDQTNASELVEVSGLRRSNSSPDLTQCQHQKLTAGTLPDSDIQQTYTRSLALKQEAANLHQSSTAAAKKVTEEAVKADQAKLSPIEEQLTPGRQRRPGLVKAVSLQIGDDELDQQLSQFPAPHKSLQKTFSLDQECQLSRGLDASGSDASTQPPAQLDNKALSRISSSSGRVRHVSTTAIPNASKLTSTSFRQESNIEPPTGSRMRSYTVTGARPTRLTTSTSQDTSSNLSTSDDSKQHTGTNPSFIFLQLYHNNLLGSTKDRPVLLPSSNEAIVRALKMLDFVHATENHTIGVVYVGPRQADDETAILSNSCGSPRYTKFLPGLGQLLRVADCNPAQTFMGGLDKDGRDGEFMYAWHEDFVQVAYHVATLMPKRETDVKCNDKKRHIGNDYVHIVYNDSREPYKIGTITSQFNYVSIVIEPLDHDSSSVTVQTKDDIVDIIGHTDTKVISDVHLGMLVRQMAVHGNFASKILQQQKRDPQHPYISNWVDRLRKIKQLHNKVNAEQEGGGAAAGAGGGAARQRTASPVGEDFSDFV